MIEMLVQTLGGLGLFHLQKDADPNWQRLLNLIHALDHLQRIHEHCKETAKLEAIRWLRRVSRHLARISEHMEKALLSIG